jgi:DMSO/TMAO reductase YedYZ heme-binding membrane subunit
VSRRTRHHLALAAGSAALLSAAVAILPYVTVAERLSVMSAWTCLGLLGAALLFGPLYLEHRRSQPANYYLRRDIGIWSAVHAGVHFYFGNVVAMNPVYIGRFVRAGDEPLSAAARDQLFTLGSVVGLLIAVVFLVLLLLSSDAAVRRIGLDRWKKLQRVALLALWLTLLHGVAFQLLEARFLPLALMLLVGVAIVLVRQRAYRATE